MRETHLWINIKKYCFRWRIQLLDFGLRFRDKCFHGLGNGHGTSTLMSLVPVPLLLPAVVPSSKVLLRLQLLIPGLLQVKAVLPHKPSHMEVVPGPESILLHK